MPTEPLSEDLLAFHLKPQPDETFDSWVLRLASAHALTVRQLLDGIAPAPNERVKCIARVTALPISRAEQALLRTPDPDSEVPDVPRADHYWVTEGDRDRRTMHGPGHPYCPICLSADEIPYMRRRWARSYVNVCDVHQVGLLDRCVKCWMRVCLELTALHAHAPWAEAPVVLCSRCGGDLRAGVDLAREIPVASDEIERVQILEETVRTGWVTVPGLPPMRSLLFFPVLAVLVNLGAFRVFNIGAPRSTRPIHSRNDWYENLLRMGPLKWDPFSDLHAYHHGSSVWPHPGELPMDRRGILSQALWLLGDWPERLVDTCKLDHVWADLLLRGFADPPPFWYWSAVMEHLQQERHIAPQEAAWRRGHTQRALELNAVYVGYLAACDASGKRPINPHEWGARGKPSRPRK